MITTTQQPVKVLIVAVPETSGSALYGMFDVLKSAGSIWESLVREKEGPARFQVSIVSPEGKPFACGNGIPVSPDYAIADDPPADILILPELWLGPDDDFRDRHPALLQWIRQRHDDGTLIYSACSGAIMLAATGLLWMAARPLPTGPTGTCSSASTPAFTSTPPRAWCSPTRKAASSPPEAPPPGTNWPSTSLPATPVPAMH